MLPFIQLCDEMRRRALQQNSASVYSERKHRANRHKSDQDASVRVDDVR